MPVQYREATAGRDVIVVEREFAVLLQVKSGFQIARLLAHHDQREGRDKIAARPCDELRAPNHAVLIRPVLDMAEAGHCPTECR